MEIFRRFQTIAVAMMNTELIYAVLMGTGWFFLISWLVALGVAYAKAFGNDPQWESAFMQDRAIVRGRDATRDGVLTNGAGRR
jgi:hypothetical protein